MRSPREENLRADRALANIVAVAILVSALFLEDSSAFLRFLILYPIIFSGIGFFLSLIHELLKNNR